MATPALQYNNYMQWIDLAYSKIREHEDAVKILNRKIEMLRYQKDHLDAKVLGFCETCKTLVARKVHKNGDFASECFHTDKSRDADHRACCILWEPMKP
jgi:hypothetical protein